MKWYLDGLKFGMLLQLAIGPMCLLVFNTAKNMGFINALSLVSAIALIDAFYIYLAGIGVSRLLLQERVKICVSVTGAFVLCLFGINMILEVVDRDIVLYICSYSDAQSVFGGGVGGDAAAVGGDDRPAEGKSQTEAAPSVAPLVAGIKHVKDPFLRFVRDTGTVVGDDHLHGILFPVGGKTDV